MRETDFIEQNRDKWERFERVLESDNPDPEELRELYVQTTDDLSYSRTFYPNRSVRLYLNGLAQRTFLHLYRGRRGEVGRFFTFWTDELPRIVYHRRRALLVALISFLIAMLIGVLSYRIDPEFAEVILGDDYVAMTEANIENGDPMAVYKQRGRFGMALHITFNNILVALLTFVAGVFLGVGSIAVLVRNGVMVGVFQYFFYARGNFAETPIDEGTSVALSWLSRLLVGGGEGLERLFWVVAHLGSDQSVFRESLLTIWIHGALEISSIVIAGGAGLTLGSGLLFPGTLTRWQAFVRSSRDGLKIMLGTVPLFVIAGFLEGFVTRETEMPDTLRFAFILVCFAFIGWYYVVYPRTVVAERPPPEQREIARLGRTDQGPVRLQRIRTLGGRSGLALDLLRRRMGYLTGGLFLLTFGFCFLSFQFSGSDAFFRYQFDSWPFADFHNMHELLTSFGRDRNLSYSVLVALGFYGIFRLVAGILTTLTDLKKPERGWRSELSLFGICLLLAGCFAFNGVVTFIAFFLVFPFLVVWAFAAYFDRAGVATVFGMVYRNLSPVYAPFILSLVVLVPLVYLLDTAVFSTVFSFLEWVLYTTPENIDARNVSLQAFSYYFIFSGIFAYWVASFALVFGHLNEQETAGDLRERIGRMRFASGRPTDP